MNKGDNKMKNAWLLSKNTYDSKKRAGMEPVFTLGNGYMSCRGFFEEEQEGIYSLGGIYMAGIFGEARYKAWKGDGREFVNTPNFFYTSIVIDREQVVVDESKVSDFKMVLDMEESRLIRSYIWSNKEGKKVKVEFERFVSKDNIHLAGQKIRITPIDFSPEIQVTANINPDITNLNLVSSEPWPVQPGVKHLEVIKKDCNNLTVAINKPDKIVIAQGQKVTLETPDTLENLQVSDDNLKGKIYSYSGIEGKIVEMSKMVSVYTSLDCEDNLEEMVNKQLDSILKYNDEFKKHCLAWKSCWHTSDIHIDGSEEDQSSLRYNIFQLIQACPEHNSKLSIGARGLTGEMYEGCIFWDTEIFMLPFFTFTNPLAGGNLLEHRYHTLPEARLHAKSNWFKGAMYAWQASEKGIEQTPQGVGAYYSIHVISDITYAILEYWYATEDSQFMFDKGAEILIETARFWESRVHKDPVTGEYHILAVRGPNEYDVIVNNNVYTNMMAQQNLILCMEIIELMKAEYTTQWEKLKDKINFDEKEIAKWQDIIDKIIICYNEELDLYEEDDMYFKRVPLDMKKVKPTAKRIIDTTIPYEGLMLYQITKQADVLHLMKNLHWRFTKQQMLNAWEYYVPKTCNDSSLSYSMHSVMASKLGLVEQAYKFFDISANLDIRDVQLNTISGLHFANFGGTWQAAIFGFGGMSIDKNTLEISPQLPAKWKGMSFKIWYLGNLLSIKILINSVEIIIEKHSDKAIKVKVFDEEFMMDKINNKKNIDIT